MATIKVLDPPARLPLQSSPAAAIPVAIPGEAVANSQDGMRGHGTYIDPVSQDVLACVAGNIERVNKLVSVKPLRARYRPEVGDLVIGRILEVGQGRWSVDCQARLHATLLLASVNLPGGVQRRKLESDELQMRTFFQEGDLLVAEVQSLSVDGAISLHTRSLKYGKLRNGRLVIVPPTLIVRLKSHFHLLPCGVSLIIGLNGCIWVYASPQSTSSAKRDVAFGDIYKGTPHARMSAMHDEDEGRNKENEAEMALLVYSSVNDHPLDGQTLEAIARVAGVITVLAKYSIPLTDSIISAAYSESISVTNKKSKSSTMFSFSPSEEAMILNAVGVDIESSL